MDIITTGISDPLCTLTAEYSRSIYYFFVKKFLQGPFKIYLHVPFLFKQYIE